MCQWCHSVVSSHDWRIEHQQALLIWICRLGLQKRVGEMQWAPHTLNEGPHQAWAVCLVLFNVSVMEARLESVTTLQPTQFLIWHVRSLRRSLDRLSTACKICSFFSCHFLAKRHCWPSVDNVFTFLITLLYKYLTSYSTRFSSLHVQARLGCDAETPSETVRFQDALMKNHSAMWLQSSSDKSIQKCNLFGSSGIFLSQCCVFLFLVQDLRNFHQNFNFWGRARRKRSKHSSRRRRRSGTVKRDEGLQYSF